MCLGSYDSCNKSFRVGSLGKPEKQSSSACGIQSDIALSSLRQQLSPSPGSHSAAAAADTGHEIGHSRRSFLYSAGCHTLFWAGYTGKGLWAGARHRQPLQVRTAIL